MSAEILIYRAEVAKNDSSMSLNPIAMFGGAFIPVYYGGGVDPSLIDKDSAQDNKQEDVGASGGL